MRPIPVDAFRQALGELSAETFADFVADLWRARGRHPRRAGDALSVKDPYTGDRKLLYPLAAGEAPGAVPPDADVVVAASGANAPARAGVEVVDADELHRLVRYGVDRPASLRLLETHLGYEPPPDDAGTGDPAGRSGTADDTPARGAGATGPGSADGTGRPREASAESLRETDDSPSGQPPGNADAAGVEADGSASDPPRAGRRGVLVAAGAVLGGLGGLALADGTTPGGYLRPGGTASTPTDRPAVPGVGAGGVDDPAALATAHVDALEATSYTIESRRTLRTVDGTLWSSLTLAVALTAGRTYLAFVATAGPNAPVLLGTPSARATFWSDGERYLRRFRRDGETTFNTFRPPNDHVGSWRYWVHTVPFADQGWGPETFYRTLFGNVPTRLAGSSTDGQADTYHVREDPSGSLPPDPRFAADVDAVRDLSLWARLAEPGVVSALDLAYTGDVEGDDGTRTVDVGRTVRYRDVGETTVDRPSWYDRAVGAGTATPDP